MQAQAMHAAAANAAWNQSNNPYLSGLCFPYNLYGAPAPQQLYAAYARSAAPLRPSSMPNLNANKAVRLLRCCVLRRSLSRGVILRMCRIQSVSCV